MTRQPLPAAGESLRGRRPEHPDAEGIADPGPQPEETARKAIHIVAALVATGIAWRAPERVATTILAGAALLALTIEVARLYIAPARRVFYRVVGFMLRPHERCRITGATTLALGFAGAILLFPPHMAAVGFLYAGVGDAAAALIGRRFGRHRTARGKSLEGSVAFFLVAVLAGWATPGIGLLPATCAAFATTLLEAGSLPIDDNLYLPAAGAAATWAAVALLA